MQLLPGALLDVVVKRLLASLSFRFHSQNYLGRAEPEPSHSLGSAHRFAIELNKLNLACVFALRALAGPAAIARLVVPIVIDTVYRVSGWAFSHVRDKVLKTSPAFANRDAATAVIMGLGDLRICASLKHRAPNSVRPCVRHAMAKSSRIRPDGVLLKAAAGLRITGSQRRLSHPNYCPAIALRHHAINANAARIKVWLATLGNRKPSEFMA
ncbi:hypothetical protein [Ralstonia mannitolilytica]|uniref:hypothetical protein n=1 Tax=Ralstonia mannitolilytica TaxID=105219 RepID=UPI001425BAA5|nr:hypothetical protein [Ralstonia mannitolilytica]